jgi:hypothetical protein
MRSLAPGKFFEFVVFENVCLIVLKGKLSRASSRGGNVNCLSQWCLVDYGLVRQRQRTMEPYVNVDLQVIIYNVRRLFSKPRYLVAAES